MSEENGHNPQEQGQPQPQQFPVLLGEICPQGLLIRVVSSKVEEHRILISTPNADQLAVAWLINRPDEIYLDLIRMRKKAIAERETLAAAVRNPYKIPAGSRGN